MGGGSTRALNIAKCLVRRGHDVRVIASAPHYPGGASIFKTFKMHEENIEGIQVLRVPTLGLRHEGFVNRLILFSWYGLFSILGVPKFCTVQKVLSIGPHPFADPSAFLMKIMSRCSLTVDISDPWPETWPLKNRILNSVLQGLGYSLNKILFEHLSDGLMVYNERCLDFIVRRYNYKKPTAIVYNSADTTTFLYDVKLKSRKECFKNILGRSVDGRFVFLYHGVIGPYQKLENVVKAAAIGQRQLDKAIFVIIGEGEERKRVERVANSEALKNVVFINKLGRDIIPRIVAESDIGIVSIVPNSPLTAYVSMPLKAAEFLACGTPVLAPKGSFIGETVTKFGAGYQVDFSDPSSIYEGVRKAYINKDGYAAMADRARQLAVKLFSIDSVGEAVNNILKA